MGPSLPPTYERCLVSLSRGGADADVVREFDIGRRAFVEDGFTLPESKGSAGWIDIDTLYVQRDFGEGSLDRGQRGRRLIPDRPLV